MKNELTCPSGHTLPPAEFRSYVDMTVEELDDAITFTCPGGKRGHTFSLRKAVAAKMFTIEEAARIRESGKQHKAKFERDISDATKGRR